MAKKGFDCLVPPVCNPKDDFEAWLEYFARCKVRFIERKDPVTGKIDVILRRENRKLGGGGKHLLGKETRLLVVSAFLAKFGSIDKINQEIEKRES